MILYNIQIDENIKIDIDDIESLDENQLSYLIKKNGFDKSSLSDKINYDELLKKNISVNIYEALDIGVDYYDVVSNLDYDDIERLAENEGLLGGYYLEKYQDTYINNEKLKLFIENIDNISSEDLEKIINK